MFRFACRRRNHRISEHKTQTHSSLYLVIKTKLNIENKYKQYTIINRCTFQSLKISFPKKSTSMKSLTKIILIALLLPLFNVSNCQSLPQFLPYGYSIKSTVARVIDGDTFVLSDSQHVRILGVNTPEIARLGKTAEPFADSAASFIKSLIEGKSIKLTFDSKTYDIFGRLLSYVWLTNTQGSDSLFIQAELLKAGLCRISHYPKGKRYYDLFYNLRRTARRKHLGIWSND